MNEGQLTRALAAGNAWWREPRWERDDRDLRPLSDTTLDYEPVPLSGIVPNGLYVLRGPRRVGKSLEIKRAISKLIRDGVDPRQIVHFACDELRRGDLQRLVKAGRDILTRGVLGPRYWFLDEITSVAGWPEAIKWLRDNTAFGEDCVVLTGSSAHDLADARKLLAGRLGGANSSDRLLLPMDFRAFARAMGLSTAPQPSPIRVCDFFSSDVESSLIELLPWLDELLGLWELYLRVGGFPRAVADQLAYGQVQRDFTDALWDVTAGEAIRGAATSPAQVNAMLTRLTSSLTTPMSIESVRKDMGVDSPHTAKARVSDLVFAYLAWPCHLRHGDLPKLSSQSKYYFIDPLVARLASIRGGGRIAEPDSSALTEQQLGLELIRCVERERPGTYTDFSEVMYQRTASKEVDFCGPAFGRMGFEGKYVDDNWRRQALTLKAAFGRGVLATRAVLDTNEPVWAVPAPFVAWMLNQ